jgi:hypothetical protein
MYQRASLMATSSVGVPLVVEMTRLPHIPMPDALVPIQIPFAAASRPSSRAVALVSTKRDDQRRDDHV